jgi:hypothetical protein
MMDTHESTSTSNIKNEVISKKIKINLRERRKIVSYKEIEENESSKEDDVSFSTKKGKKNKIKKKNNFINKKDQLESLFNWTQAENPQKSKGMIIKIDLEDLYDNNLFLGKSIYDFIIPLIDCILIDFAWDSLDFSCIVSY